LTNTYSDPPTLGNLNGDDGIKKGQSAKFKSDCALYGFEISEQWYPYDGTSFVKKSIPREDQGYLQYQTDIQQVLLQNAYNPNVFSVVYRVVTSPVARRYYGVMGIGSHSDTWYTRKVNSSVNLGSDRRLGQWAPKNEQAEFSGTLGISVDSKGPSISTSVNFNFSQLEVISRTNAPRPLRNGIQHQVGQ
jgi:hypothetical protein